MTLVIYPVFGGLNIDVQVIEWRFSQPQREASAHVEIRTAMRGAGSKSDRSAPSVRRSSQAHLPACVVPDRRNALTGE